MSTSPHTAPPATTEKEPRWIQFRLSVTPAPRKTRVWDVLSKDGTENLGYVSWAGNWRRYAFTPSKGTYFEQECLRDIAAFLEARTREWREGRKRRDC